MEENGLKRYFLNLNTFVTKISDKKEPNDNITVL